MEIRGGAGPLPPIADRREELTDNHQLEISLPQSSPHPTNTFLCLIIPADGAHSYQLTCHTRQEFILFQYLTYHLHNYMIAFHGRIRMDLYRVDRAEHYGCKIYHG